MKPTSNPVAQTRISILWFWPSLVIKPSSVISEISEKTTSHLFRSATVSRYPFPGVGLCKNQCKIQQETRTRSSYATSNGVILRNYLVHQLRTSFQMPFHFFSRELKQISRERDMNSMREYLYCFFLLCTSVYNLRRVLVHVQPRFIIESTYKFKSLGELILNIFSILEIFFWVVLEILFLLIGVFLSSAVINKLSRDSHWKLVPPGPANF
jgi:hypothetical protein